MVWYRFSAFWLRSKCSICSYQLNIWYVPHWGTTILNWFLELGVDTGACSDYSTGWPGIAVPPGSAHSPWGEIQNTNDHYLPRPLSMATLICNPALPFWGVTGLLKQYWPIWMLLLLVLAHKLFVIYKRVISVLKVTVELYQNETYDVSLMYVLMLCIANKCVSK